MIFVHKLPSPKRIAHNQLIAELGYPCSLHLDPDGLCEAIQVEDPYYSGWPPVAVPLPVDARDPLTVAAAHVAE